MERSVSMQSCRCDRHLCMLVALFHAEVPVAMCHWEATGVATCDEQVTLMLSCKARESVACLGRRGLAASDGQVVTNDCCNLLRVTLSLLLQLVAHTSLLQQANLRLLQQANLS